MSVRRNTDPFIVQTIWNGICFYDSQGQTTTLEMLVHYIRQKINCTQTQAHIFVKQALDDKIIEEAEEYETSYYKTVKTRDFSNDNHDWYCIECHRAGTVIPCRDCPRVYHPRCTSYGREKFKDLDLKKEKTTKDYDPDLCGTCNLFSLEVDIFDDEVELNHLLGFIYERVKLWLPENLINSLSQECQPKWLTDVELKSRTDTLFRERVDYTMIKEKIETNKYKRLYELLRDIEVMYHNTAIFHGVDSQEFGAATLMLNDCVHDIKEVINCVDCYKFSNEKVNSKWFCTPCRVPHKLVWAKQKGYPYWPAKVMRETDAGIDVRFFGGKYERSVLPLTCIKPIEEDIKLLNNGRIRESSAFNKAVQELRLHQRYLKSKSPLIPSTKQSRKRSRSSNEGSTSSKSSSSSTQNEINDNIPNGTESSSGSTEYSESPSRRMKEKSLHKRKRQERNSNSIKDEELPSSVEIKDENNCHEEIDAMYNNEAVVRLRNELEKCKDKSTLIHRAMECMYEETNRLIEEHDNTLKRLQESFNEAIKVTKRKQWCFNCGEDAYYHCCWNTSYCSPSCQQQHWQAEHKRVCRRIR